MLRRVEVLRLDELGVQVGPVVRLDGHELAGELGQGQGGPGGLGQHRRAAPVCLHDLRDRRRVDVGELVHQVAAVAGQGGEVESRLLRDLLQLAGGDVDAVDLALQRAASRGGEVRPGPRRIDVDGPARGEQVLRRGVDHPVALGQLPDQRAVLRVEVEVHEAVALGEPEELPASLTPSPRKIGAA